MSKILSLIRAYAYYYGAGVLASAPSKYHPLCAKKTRSAMVNYQFDGELLKFPVKWKEAHLKPFFFKECSDRKEYNPEIKWRDGEQIGTIVKNSFAATTNLVLAREAAQSVESLKSKYPEPKIDQILQEKEKRLNREMEEKLKLG